MIRISLQMWCLGCLLLTATAATRPPKPAAEPLRPEDTPALPAEDTPAEEMEAAAAESSEPAATPDAAAPVAPVGRPVENWLEAQVELARRGFSSGSIDGIRGLQSANALKAFQRNEGLSETGELDAATKAVLLINEPALIEYTVAEEDLAALQPLPETWLGKSEQTTLAYATLIEFLGERYRVSPKYLKRLNPSVDWDAVAVGAVLQVPSPVSYVPPAKAVLLHVRLADHVLEATDETGRILAHFPVSIARDVEKRPVGELRVKVIIPNPNYTFDPAVFTESAEAQELGRKLIIPPGPNNPVGLAWIGLDRPGYGIHGTPEPEKVGRTESHGCFRLANWDALTLLKVVTVGLPVLVEP